MEVLLLLSYWLWDRILEEKILRSNHKICINRQCLICILLLLLHLLIIAKNHLLIHLFVFQDL